ncbi:zinc-binding dehydrogenase [Neorhizobium galegae]|uniref:zinc-binding dehydrogenase n=1 Tax=Neorhizobium galegae TaxID=399 RepID=UPI000621C530|nr:zinc-binding dehydrogenase [Neorhizobium galegae]CDZ58779.1 Hypothetical protein NGAL_HAMBI2566_31610 [Neorhizobium galegae bv. orientalis]KAB1121409.1 zinc-binding dehydrogenase [Neorhizobium galegae]MCQ1570587.1 zinc-binding dehydrogenase [Neorhizobium galegae]MCQ1809177.1 zinc-binding dehydrogenase [Neorhizobium galegae]MCQ1838610.1 zinc-binding dehydrogenase [Neorhizobium galegae]
MGQGDRVLIVGAGALSGLSSPSGRRLGAGGVAVTDIHCHQQARAMDVGARSFVTADPDQAANIETAFGDPPDIVFECVGRPGLIDHCMGLVRTRGKVVVLGLCTPRDHLDSFRAISKEVSVIMSVSFDMKEFATAINALDSGRYAPQNLISDTVSLADLPPVFEALRKRTSQCKVLVDPFGS